MSEYLEVALRVNVLQFVHVFVRDEIVVSKSIQTL